MRRCLVLVVATLAPIAARAQPAPAEDVWPYETTRGVMLDGGLAVGFPTALPTGLARGIGVGLTAGDRWTWGARVLATTATESAPAWLVTHRELRVRATGSLRHVAGRGTLALRAGLGGAFVHEHRLRHQGMRAGVEGDDLETSAVALIPVGSLEGVIEVRVRGRWSLLLAGGPTVAYDDRARGGWTAELGVGWHP